MRQNARFALGAGAYSQQPYGHRQPPLVAGLRELREVARNAISDEAFAELSAMSLVRPFLEVRVED